MDLANEVFDHFFGDFEVGDDAVAQRPNGADVAGGTAEHLLGFLDAQCLHVFGRRLAGGAAKPAQEAAFRQTAARGHGADRVRQVIVIRRPDLCIGNQLVRVLPPAGQ